MRFSHFCTWTMFTFLCLSPLYPQKIDTKNGVRITHNGKQGKWGNNPKVSLKLIRTFGGIDIDNEDYVFVMPQDVVMDSALNLYALDS